MLLQPSKLVRDNTQYAGNFGSNETKTGGCQGGGGKRHRKKQTRRRRKQHGGKGNLSYGFVGGENLQDFSFFLKDL